MRRKLRPFHVAILALACVVALAVREWGEPSAPRQLGARAPPVDGAPASTRERTNALLEAIRDQRSEVWVEFDGEVAKLLADDREGSRHQRFLVLVADDARVLIAHNIDLAPRVPVTVGDEVAVRGRFEWNDRGGVVHWTHHDPQSVEVGGWILHRGQRYE